MREAVEKPRRTELRRLSEEEIALWAEVAKSVARRRGASLPAIVEPSEAYPAVAQGRHRAGVRSFRGAAQSAEAAASRAAGAAPEA